MARYSDTLVDQNGRPVAGAIVTIIAKDGQLAVLTNDAAGPISNPFIVGDTGFFYFNAIDAVYDAQFRFGGRLIREDEIIVGEPPAFVGPPGGSNNTRANLTQLKAAATTDLTSLYDGSLWTWTPGDFTGQADDVNIVKSDNAAINLGAWVRQLAEGVSYRRTTAYANAGPGTAASTFDAGTINALENVTLAQRAALRSNSAVAGLADAINDVLNDAGAKGAAVFIPWGLYDLRAPLMLPASVSLIGEMPSYGGTDYDPGLSRTTGTVLYKNHTGNAIQVTGSGPYAVSGLIRGLSITGERTTPGNGLVVDQVGSLRIEELRVLGVGGDGIILGTSPGDVTGQIHMSGIYVNNPGGVCIRNRSKWLKASQIETDGGTYSYYGSDSPNADITQFHFEGASNKAVVFAGANGNARLRGGFIGLTDPVSLKGIELQSAAGNTDVTIENVQIVGHGALTAAIEVNGSARRTRIHSCEIQGAPIGVLDASDGTSISETHFLACGMGISAQSDRSRYRGNLATGTTGPCWLDHVAGGFGVWSDNVVDKPFRPTLYGGMIGNFGTNRVCNNSGYKTRTGGLTAGITSGTAIPHGLTVTPFTTDIRRLGSPDPADLAWTYDATNIVPTWSGGGTMQFFWSARAVCEDA